MTAEPSNDPPTVAADGERPRTPRQLVVIDWIALVLVGVLLAALGVELVLGARSDTRWARFVSVAQHSFHVVPLAWFLWNVVRGRRRRSPGVYWCAIFVLAIGGCFALAFAARAFQEGEHTSALLALGSALLCAIWVPVLGYSLALGGGRRTLESPGGRG
ncbi:MAG: hypothetical protein IT453_13740 [Planctomycetes bacterium]|nr:hypothetical protein [Planctomycetota bacterium]